MIRYACIVIAALAGGFLASQGARADSCTNAEIGIKAPALSVRDQRAFIDSFRTGLAKVCDWWGGGFKGPYLIDIQDRRGTAMALIPAWRGDRGHVVFPMRTIRQSNAPIIHEIVHVIATNGNRFLAEGLAVHAHHRLGGQAAFPNFGRDLHSRAAPFSQNADIAALDRLPVPARLRLPDLDVQPAYLVAGSFVRFMIETRGLAPFRELYARTPLVPGARNAGPTRRWSEIYGTPLAVLAEEWRDTITR